MGEDQPAIANCHFKFRCEAKWDQLVEVVGQDFSKIRHCSDCKKSVFKVSSKEELIENVIASHCVAVDNTFLFPEIPESITPQITLGLMDFDEVSSPSKVGIDNSFTTDDPNNEEGRGSIFKRLKEKIFSSRHIQE